MNRALRLAIAGTLGVLQFAAFVTILATYERPVGEFGYNVGADGVTIAAVEPGLPAAKAGLRPGDRIVYASFPVRGRLNVIQSEWVSLEHPLHFQIVRDGAVHDVTLEPEALPELYGVAQLSFAFAGAILAAVGLALVWLRPCRMTWGFAMISPLLLLPDALMIWAHGASPAIGFSYQLFVIVIYAMQAAGVMIFGARFPSDRASGLNRWIDRSAIPLALVLTAIWVYVDATIWFGSSPPAAWALFAQNNLATSVPALSAIAAMVWSYAFSDGNLRSRLLPTLATFVLLIGADTFQSIELSYTSNPAIILVSDFAFAFAAAAFAAAVLYGVTRHRVIDVNFFVGRTLVYTTLTAIVVGTFTFIEFLFGKLLERSGFAAMLEIAVAVGIGLSLNPLHNKVDGLIDVLLFRRRHAAEQRLARVAVALPQAASRKLADDMLAIEPADALGLASAAVFALAGESGEYHRSVATGWGPQHATTLPADDHLVVLLASELRALALDDVRWPRTDVPGGNDAAIYAVPVAIGRRLEAFALYGGHTSGEELDPDERRSLRALGRAAALAYDQIVVNELRETVDTLRSENAALQHSERTLTDLLGKRLA